ncbi:probable L-type lectin-domain containing receptor kinase VI.1 [Impatiens glandulifera]|uniref:probable L-type lectin-domain containing receptor kinase VI.1 n=1 Tax=Impatiens glandulifera TaxID=253017 RepID=UPI001FB0E375|nr:probable L-type lectin-domain containing receptor kinase VI.1 [Impatiens glandulifera]
MSAFSFIFQLLLLQITLLKSNSLQFSFTGFSQPNNLILDLSAKPTSDGALQLTDNKPASIGHVFYPQPFKLFTNTTNSINITSFTTYFVFQIVTSPEKTPGHGLAFVLSPSNKIMGAEDGHFLGILNNTSNGLSSNRILAVDFDTISGFNKTVNFDTNHVGININSMESEERESVGYHPSMNDNRLEFFKLVDGNPIQAWIEYNGDTKRLNVTVAPMNQTKPIAPLISHPTDLSLYLTEEMYIGFSSATGKKEISIHYILGWNFSSNGSGNLDLDLQKLPVQPKLKKSNSYSPVVEALIAVLSIIALLFIGSLVLIVVYRRKMRFERLEDWEMDSPHRFNYNDLYYATKGFKESQLLGFGGSGSVYKGILPTTRSEVAVKKISDRSNQGMREFSAEIECLGRLRHRNLVNLQGWCKKKNDLLLIYDYIPNGSLHSLLFKPKNGFFLTWEQRMNIVNGTAAGLLYLHEEWEQVVIHRDVKLSNILVDADMNARLGDFGLARLYDHSEDSHNTNIVGTIGYIAPELAQLGISSTCSDVFAFGIVLLEIATGKGPNVHVEDGRGNIPLVDWVEEGLENGGLFEIVDSRLGSDFVENEIELVLRIGLLCSCPKAEGRPSMRQVKRYLDGDDPIPDRGRSRIVEEIKVVEGGSQRLNDVSIEVTADSNSYSTVEMKVVTSSSFAGR